MIIVWSVLLILFCGTGAIIFFTVRQSHHIPKTYPTEGVAVIRAHNEVLRQLSHQRTQTAILREGVTALAECVYKILVVDDEVDTRFLFRMEFRRDKGLSFFYAQNGKEAIQRINAIVFDLVIVDLCLPDMSGELIVEEVAFKQKLPCIVLSARLSDEFRQKMIMADVPIVPKPVNRLMLRTKICEILQLHEAT